MNTNGNLRIQQPLMIAGLARSGTTWLGKLFDAHPRVIYRHEPDRPPLFPSLPLIAGADLATNYAPALKIFAERLPEMTRVLEAGSIPVLRKSEESPAQFQLRRAATITARAAATRLGNIRIPFGSTAGKSSWLREDAPRPLLVWKSVLSVGRLGCLLAAWPRLNVILLIRNPCGVIESRQRGVAQGEISAVSQSDMNSLVNENSELVETLGQRDLLSTPQDYSALRWAIMNSQALEIAAANPGRCRVVRYEDLSMAPTETLQDLFAFSGIVWDPQVERFLTYSRAKDSQRYYGLRRTPEAVDRWRLTLSEDARKRIYRIVGETSAGRMYASTPA